MEFCEGGGEVERDEGLGLRSVSEGIWRGEGRTNVLPAIYGLYPYSPSISPKSEP